MPVSEENTFQADFTQDDVGNVNFTTVFTKPFFVTNIKLNLTSGEADDLDTWTLQLLDSEDKIIEKSGMTVS